MKVNNNIRVSRMHKGDYGKIKAFFDVEVTTGVTIKGFKLVEGKDGLFVGNPSTYNKQKDEYQDNVYIVKEVKSYIEEIAKKEYNGENDTEQEDFGDFDKF